MPQYGRAADTGEPASKGEIEVPAPLHRLQPTLNNRHPASKLLVLGSKQLECSLSLESVFMLGFDIFAECVDPLGHFLMVAVDLLV